MINDFKFAVSVFAVRVWSKVTTLHLESITSTRTQILKYASIILQITVGQFSSEWYTVFDGQLIISGRPLTTYST